MALSGDYVIVKMDDKDGTLRQFASGEVISVDLGLQYEQHDVSGFSLGIHEVVNGLLRAPVILRGYLTTDASTGTHTVIQGAYAAQATVSLEVQVGQNAPPQAGDPKFTGEFIVAGYKPSIVTGGAVTFEARLLPATGAAPAWTQV
jgi:hypothetical protein